MTPSQISPKSFTVFVRVVSYYITYGQKSSQCGPKLEIIRTNDLYTRTCSINWSYYKYDFIPLISGMSRQQGTRVCCEIKIELTVLIDPIINISWINLTNRPEVYMNSTFLRPSLTD